MGRQARWHDGFTTQTAAAVAWAALAWAGASPAAAQSTIESLPLAAAYGSGVHGYFAGDYDRAYEDLTNAIEAGTMDPRAYYFRGLAALRLGRSDEAEADFTAGATRESEGMGAWPVARSLERVQGPDRLRLERHRTRARVALLARQREADRRRYSEIDDLQENVLRRRRPAGLPPEATDGANPFENGDRPTPAEPLPPGRPVETAVPDGSTAERVEAAAAEPENAAAQRDERMEAEASEVENAASQRDGQAEVEAAAGDR